MIAIAAKAGLGVVAGQDVQLANGETVSVISGADTQTITGGKMRVHCGQAIGVLAGAEKAGEGNVGLQLIAGKGAIDYQAQADELKVRRATRSTSSVPTRTSTGLRRAQLIDIRWRKHHDHRRNITVQCTGNS
jgi:uncharacterized protein (DUF2345 family)